LARAAPPTTRWTKILPKSRFAIAVPGPFARGEVERRSWHMSCGKSVWKLSAIAGTVFRSGRAGCTCQLEEGYPVDRFSRDDLRALLANRQAPCVSLFMPTTRGVRLEDAKRWKNLVREAEERLTGDGVRSPEAKELLRPAWGLVDDIPFWQNVSAGLAFFLA